MKGGAGDVGVMRLQLRRRFASRLWYYNKLQGAEAEMFPAMEMSNWEKRSVEDPSDDSTCTVSVAFCPRLIPAAPEGQSSKL